VSAGEINGDGYSLIMADFDHGVHLARPNENNSLSPPNGERAGARGSYL
jgi:hypothetical protein